MIPTLRRHAIAFLAAFGLALPASATTYSIDFTDLWWNPSENGWGVNLIQQSNVIFATFFVYDSNNAPHWYVASDLVANGPSLPVQFTGSLYQTSGPYFGGPYASSVVVSPVGNVTLTFDSPTTGTLVYTVGSTTVTKPITRQTWADNMLAGYYLGGLTAMGSNCRNVANGPVAMFNTLRIQQVNDALTMTVYFSSPASPSVLSICTFTGTYVAQGRLGSVTNGAFSCSGGAVDNHGSFNLAAIDAGRSGLSAAFTGSDQYCTYAGNFGGVRDVLVQTP